MFRFNKALIAAVFALVSTASAQSAAKAAESKLFDAGKLIEDVRTLSADDMEGRSLDRPSNSKAREHITKRFVEVGLKPAEQAFPVRVRGQETPAKGINFIATIEGKKKADKYIVITAHYDHLGVRNGQNFNGADCNASETAALFANGA